MRNPYEDGLLTLPSDMPIYLYIEFHLHTIPHLKLILIVWCIINEKLHKPLTNV